MIGARVCPGKSFSINLLFQLSLKIVTELNLSFGGFVDEINTNSSGLKELRYLGMSLVHHYPFYLDIEPAPEHLEHKIVAEEATKTWVDKTFTGGQVKPVRSG